MIPTNITIGIDPGLNGGVAVRVQTGALVTWQLFPIRTTDVQTRHPNLDVWSFIELLSNIETSFGKRPDLIVLEQPPYIPGNGGFATRSLFKAYGEIRGVLIALQYYFWEVPPKTWQKLILGTASKVKTKKTAKQKKEGSINAAQAILPKNVYLPTKGPRTKALHDGIADAVCLAEYGNQLWPDFIASKGALLDAQPADK